MPATTTTSGQVLGWYSRESNPVPSGQAWRATKCATKKSWWLICHWAMRITGDISTIYSADDNILTNIIPCDVCFKWMCFDNEYIHSDQNTSIVYTITVNQIFAFKMSTELLLTCLEYRGSGKSMPDLIIKCMWRHLT